MWRIQTKNSLCKKTRSDAVDFETLHFKSDLQKEILVLQKRTITKLEACFKSNLRILEICQKMTVQHVIRG